MWISVGCRATAARSARRRYSWRTLAGCAPLRQALDQCDRGGCDDLLAKLDRHKTAKRSSATSPKRRATSSLPSAPRPSCRCLLTGVHDGPACVASVNWVYRATTHSIGCPVTAAM
jgi:hypothetical protein